MHCKTKDVKVGHGLVEMTVIFVQVITLPVELSLSRRAFHPASELSVAYKGAWNRKLNCGDLNAGCLFSRTKRELQILIGISSKMIFVNCPK